MEGWALSKNANADLRSEKWLISGWVEAGFFGCFCGCQYNCRLQRVGNVSEIVVCSVMMKTGHLCGSQYQWGDFQFSTPEIKKSRPTLNVEFKILSVGTWEGTEAQTEVVDSKLVQSWLMGCPLDWDEYGSKHHAQASHKSCSLTLFAVLEFAVMLRECLNTFPYIYIWVDMMKDQYLKSRIKVNESGLRHQLVLKRWSMKVKCTMLLLCLVFLVGFIMFIDFIYIFLFVARIIPTSY